MSLMRDRSHESGARYRSAGSRSTVGRVFRTRVASHCSCLLANLMLAKAAGHTPCTWGCQAEERAKSATAGEINCPSGKSARASDKRLSSPARKNISLNPSGKSLLQIRLSRPQEGRLAIVTDAGRDAVDAVVSQDERHQRGRRSRVVLTPRRWRQVGGMIPFSDGGKKARSPVRSPGRARNKPSKPLRREGRIVSTDLR
jgi:hypothetical protein